MQLLFLISKVLILIIVAFAFFAGCGQTLQVGDNISEEWFSFLEEDIQYRDSYNTLKAPEESFKGTLTYQECPEVSILMRCTPYKLNGISVYVGSQELKEYGGKEVEIIGKKHSFALEGEHLTEIWAAKIRAQEK